jgi:transposase, IS6 family
MGESQPALFRGRHFRDEIIVMCVRWYVRHPLSYCNIEKIMPECGLSIDHSTIARGVLHYGPILEERIRAEVRWPNRSSRVDEIHNRVAGKWTYSYRAIDSAGNTIDFLLSPKRDRIAAKGFLQIALWRVAQIRPRVINVDGQPAYSGVIDELRRAGQLGRNCRYRVSAYINKRIEQDHRFVKKRVVASQCSDPRMAR